MNRESSTRALVESGILTAIAVVLALISFYLPLVGIVTLFLWPLPITLIYVRHNIKYTLISFFVTGILLGIIAGPLQAFYIMLLFGITSIVMGYCVKSNKPATVTILYMSITYFICLIASFYVFTQFIGIDLVGMFKDTMAQSIESMKETYTKFGMSQETLQKSIEQMDLTKSLIMIPGSLVIFSAVISYITYTMGGYIFKRFGHNLNRLKPFSEWYMPFQIAMGLIVFIILGYILNARGVGIGESLFINSVAIFNAAFTLVGLAAVSYFLKKRGMAKWSIFAIIFIAAVSPLSSFIELVGIFDYSLDFRRLDTNRKKFPKAK